MASYILSESLEALRSKSDLKMIVTPLIYGQDCAPTSGGVCADMLLA